MASSSSHNSAARGYNMAKDFKRHLKKELTQEKLCLKRFVKERIQLEKKVEEREDPINLRNNMGPLSEKYSAMISCLVESQERHRHRIIMLNALIDDIRAGIQEKERQVKRMEVHAS